MPALDAGTAATTTADVDVELANQGTTRDFGLILGGNLCLPNRVATARASVGKGSVEDFIDLGGGRSRAVCVATVSSAGFASGFLGQWLGRTLGEGSGLAFGRSASLVELGTRLGEFTLEAFVVQTKTIVLLAEVFELGAQVVEVRQQGGGHRHRITDLD
jgi:hypothetical protein